MAVASIKGMTVRYGRKTAVADLTVDFPEGCVGLLGPNGAGKTTLIKTLLGFLQPASGRGTVLDLDIVTRGPLIRQRIGLMPESDCHIPGMNAVTFTAYAGELSGMPAAQAIQRAHETLEYCGLGEARYRNIETYSTGMKQRIKLAQAIVHGPKLLFLDEPTNGLDPDGRDEMLKLVRDISQNKGINVILSSHLLPDIERVCDTVVVMRSGQLARQGDVGDLRQLKGNAFDVQLLARSEVFEETLRNLGVKIAVQYGSEYRLILPEDCSDAGKMLFRAAVDSGAQIRSFKSSQRSLEEVFLEALA